MIYEPALQPFFGTLGFTGLRLKNMPLRNFSLRCWVHKEAAPLCKTLGLYSVLAGRRTWQLSNFFPTKDFWVLRRAPLWLSLLSLPVAVFQSSDVHAKLVINGLIPPPGPDGKKSIDFVIRAVPPWGVHEGPPAKEFPGTQQFPILNPDPEGIFGSITKVLMNYEEAHGTIGEHGYKISDFGRTFSLTPLVSLKPACTKNVTTCSMPIAGTFANWRDEWAGIGVHKKELQLGTLSSINNNNFTQSIEHEEFKYSFGVKNVVLPELAFSLSFDIYQPLPASVPLLRANIGLGPVLPSGHFAFDYTYEGNACTIGPSLSTCDQAFVDDIKLGLEDPLMWTYDGFTRSFLLNSDLALPTIEARLVDDSLNGDVFGLNEKLVSSRSPEPPVPGPFPVLGIFATLGLSRKLRKRIKDSKLEVSAI